jgi:hypothetical protein
VKKKSTFANLLQLERVKAEIMLDILNLLENLNTIRDIFINLPDLTNKWEAIIYSNIWQIEI